MQPNHLLVRHDSLTTVHPLDDAFTMSFKAVLRHACRQAHHHCRPPRGGGRSLGRRGKGGSTALVQDAKRLAMAPG